MNFYYAEGNMVRDAELRYTGSGKPIATFSVAVNYRYGDKEGVDFIPCQAWAGVAEKVATVYKKGASIRVKGKVKTDSWEDKQSGQKRNRTYVLADSVTSLFVGERVERREKRRAAPPPEPEMPEDPDADDVPF